MLLTYTYSKKSDLFVIIAKIHHTYEFTDIRYNSISTVKNKLREKNISETVYLQLKILYVRTEMKRILKQKTLTLYFSFPVRL